MKKGRRPRRRPRLKLSDKAGPDQCPVPGENALFPAQIAGFLAVSRPVPVYPVFLNYVVSVQFAIQLSLVLTAMTFTSEEIAAGASIIATANRLQYASNQTKLNVVTQLFDRGFLTHNQGLEIFNMSPVEDGDKHYIRKEYTEVSNLDAVDDTSKEGDNGDHTGNP